MKNKDGQDIVYK